MAGAVSVCGPFESVAVSVGVYMVPLGTEPSGMATKPCTEIPTDPGELMVAVNVVDPSGLVTI